MLHWWGVRCSKLLVVRRLEAGNAVDKPLKRRVFWLWVERQAPARQRGCWLLAPRLGGWQQALAPNQQLPAHPVPTPAPPTRLPLPPSSLLQWTGMPTCASSARTFRPATRSQRSLACRRCGASGGAGGTAACWACRWWAGGRRDAFNGFAELGAVSKVRSWAAAGSAKRRGVRAHAALLCCPDDLWNAPWASLPHTPPHAHTPRPLPRLSCAPTPPR